jgi:hypothetical protein
MAGAGSGGEAKISSGQISSIGGKSVIVVNIC